MADDTRYAYAVARVRGMETRLLDRQWTERLLSESADGALKALGDSAFQHAVADVAHPDEIEKGLVLAMTETLTTVAEVSPEPELIDLFRLRADYANAKALVKATVLKMDEGDFGLTDGVGTIPLATLEAAVRDKDMTQLPGFLVEAVRDAEEAYRDDTRLASIDRVLDNALWARSLEVAREYNNAFLVDYFQREIDLTNIRTFVRMKVAQRDVSDFETAFIAGGTIDLAGFRTLFGEGLDAFARSLEYGRYGDVAEAVREWSSERAFALELACDNVLLKTVEPAKTVPYGIEPLVAFILKRTIEIKLVRAAIVAKLDGVERSVVEERLRSTHV